MLVLFVGRMNEKLAILTKIDLIEIRRKRVHISNTIVGTVSVEATTANIVRRRTLNNKGVWRVMTQLRGNFKVYRQIFRYPLSVKLGVYSGPLPKLQYRWFPMYHSNVNQ